MTMRKLQLGLFALLRIIGSLHASSNVDNVKLVYDIETRVTEAIKTGQWDRAKELIKSSHQQRVDISKKVQELVRNVKAECDEVVRLLNSDHNLVQTVHAAFQWAQCPDKLYLNVKLAHRWSSPGALEIKDEELVVSEDGFKFSGFGSHSGINKLYLLDVITYAKLDQVDYTYTLGSVGKATLTLKKKIPAVWPRLFKDKAIKRSNVSFWFDMQERLQPLIDNHTTKSDWNTYTKENFDNIGSPPSEKESVGTKKPKPKDPADVESERTTNKGIENEINQDTDAKKRKFNEGLEEKSNSELPTAQVKAKHRHDDSSIDEQEGLDSANRSDVQGVRDESRKDDINSAPKAKAQDRNTNPSTSAINDGPVDDSADL